MATGKTAKKRTNPKLIAIITLAVLLALTVFLSVLGFLGMNVTPDGLYKLLPWIPGVNADWQKALVPGYDLGGGNYIDFTAQKGDMSDDAYSKALQETVSVLGNRLVYKGYDAQALVTILPDNTVRVALPTHDAAALLETLVTSKGFLSMQDANTNQEIMNSSHIRVAQPSIMQDNETYAISIATTDEGKQLLADATTAMAEAGGGAISLVLDGTVINTAQVQSAFTDGAVQIPIGDSLQLAWNYAAFLNYGALPLTLEETASGATTDLTGENAADAVVLAGAIALLLFMVFLVVRYRLGGLLAAWTLWIVAVAACFCAAIAGLPLTLSSAIALISTIALAAGAVIIVLENIGTIATRNIPLSQAMRTGFKRSNAAVLDVHAILLIAAFALMAIGSGTIHAFSRVLCIGVCVNIVAVAILLRVLLYNCAIVIPGSCTMYTGKKLSKEAQ